MKGNKLIDDHRQISVNLLKYKSHGKQFEVAIDPDKAVAYKQGQQVDIDEILQAENVFADMKKGLPATEDDLTTVFGTTDIFKVVETMFAKGEIQFTQKYREQLHDQKIKQVVTYIQRHAMNPQTKLPHPLTRIEAALEEAKVKIDPMGNVESQAKDIVKKLQPIIPITIAQLTLSVHIQAAHAGRARGVVANNATIKSEEWGNDGSLLLRIELPAGMQETFTREIHNATNGTTEIEQVKE